MRTRLRQGLCVNDMRREGKRQKRDERDCRSLCGSPSLVARYLIIARKVQRQLHVGKLYIDALLWTVRAVTKADAQAPEVGLASVFFESNRETAREF
jgi:hypothetical protein